MVQLSATRCSRIAILFASLVSFAAITLCVASQRVFIVVSVYFVIDSVRKLLDTLSYVILKTCFQNIRPATGIYNDVRRPVGRVVAVYSCVPCPCPPRNWAPCQEGVLEEWRYSSTHSLTSELDGGEWSTSLPEWNANGTWFSQAVTHPSTNTCDSSFKIKGVHLLTKVAMLYSLHKLGHMCELSLLTCTSSAP
jgi:hypothetical protein